MSTLSHRSPARSVAAGLAPALALALAFALALAASVVPREAHAQTTPQPASSAPAPPPSASQALRIRPLAERHVASLPAGELWWRIEKFPAIDPARAAAAANAWSLAVDDGGQAWLVTLGARGGATPGGLRVAEAGPVTRTAAAAWVLRIDDASGPPGSTTALRGHPGVQAFFVLAGEQGLRAERGTLRVAAGRTETAPGLGRVLQLSSTGTSDLHALVLSIDDATAP